jgi:hypothetical protein
MKCEFGREIDWLSTCDPECNGEFCNEHFKQCPECGHWYDDLEFTYDEVTDRDICDGCYERLEDERMDE